jgi:hypothetical protein
LFETYFPVSQKLQVEAEETDTLACGQLVQLELDVSAAYFPAVQSLQFLLPTSAANFPVGQDSHFVAPMDTPLPPAEEAMAAYLPL